MSGTGESDLQLGQYVSDTQSPEPVREPHSPPGIALCLVEDTLSSSAAVTATISTKVNHSASSSSNVSKAVSGYNFPIWRRTLHRINQLKEQDTVQTWQLLTELSRPVASGRKKVLESTTVEPSSTLLPTVDLSVDGSEAFLIPTPVSALQEEQEASVGAIARGVSAEYPEFLRRLDAGVESLGSWLAIVEVVVLCSNYVSLGTLYQMGEYSIHGLALRSALSPLPEVRKSKPIFVCWCRLVGKPILAFLERHGVHTSKLWLASPLLAWQNLVKPYIIHSKYLLVCQNHLPAGYVLGLWVSFFEA